MYTSPPLSGSTLDFNPRAYSEATYAASLEKQSPRLQQQGPLLDLNRHPDSWMMAPPKLGDASLLPANMRKKVVSTRWVQFAFRILQMIAALGLFVCMASIKGAGQTQGWIMRIPPAYDAMLNVYAIYHLARPAHSRPAGSAASYHFFAFAMDGALIPFYVYIAFYSYSNYMQVPGTDGRWTTFFTAPDAATIVLKCSWLGSVTLGGLHLISVVLDFVLLIWFRKIANAPPDSNPLDVAARMRNKHRYKNSESSTSTFSLEDKKMYRASTHSYNSNASIPQGYSIPEPQNRQVPFLRSRVEANQVYSPHTVESARLARANPKSPGAFSFQSKSTRASIAEAENDKHSPFAGHSFPFPPGQDRASFNASRPGSRDRPLTSSGPQTAQDPRDARQAQTQSLLRENWTVYDDDASDLGTPRRGNSPAPTVPAKNGNTHLGPYDAVDKENTGGIRRMLTTSSSVYSDEGAAPIANDSPARNQKYYSGLAVAQQAIRYHGGSPVAQSPEPMGKTNGNRVVSRSGVELADGKVYDEPRQRNVSGKAAEEGRGGSGWERRMR